ncbi:MAG: hypothetical protein A2381_03085 [Bdellovibrionales bacterium RIFOXYB1_FULL_37_110]|nr:MAG: hypothetical protein A2381_03085 [Bdellovibrionales bacterium RIFOXYB1_FULL_37_110]
MKFSKMVRYRIFIIVLLIAMAFIFYMSSLNGKLGGYIIWGWGALVMSFPLSIIWYYLLYALIEFKIIDADYFGLMINISFIVLIYINWGHLIPWGWGKIKQRYEKKE